jgi:hypothetical protein
MVVPSRQNHENYASAVKIPGQQEQKNISPELPGLKKKPVPNRDFSGEVLLAIARGSFNQQSTGNYILNS